MTKYVANILNPSFFARDTVTVARDLIGKTLVRYHEGEYRAGIINETEAYRSDDPACHAYRGKTERTKALFGPVGHAYVYISYGIHICFNIVARSDDQVAGGVLIRSLIPTEGKVAMQQTRGNALELSNGPGKLTQALRITQEQYGISLTQHGQLFVIDEQIRFNKEDIQVTGRIGISKAQDFLWRFYVPEIIIG